MGHYASEMSCDTCGKLHCVCPPREEPPNKDWLVKPDFTVQRVCDFDAAPENNVTPYKWGNMKSSPLLKRYGYPVFKKRSEAETHAAQQLLAAIYAAREQVTHLERLLVEQPWSQK